MKKNIQRTCFGINRSLTKFKVKTGPSPSLNKSERTKNVLWIPQSHSEPTSWTKSRPVVWSISPCKETNRHKAPCTHLKNTNTREILERSQIATTRKPTALTSTVQKCGPVISDALATHRVRGCTSPRSCKYILTNRDCSGVERRTTVLTRCPRHLGLYSRGH